MAVDPRLPKKSGIQYTSPEISPDILMGGRPESFDLPTIGTLNPADIQIDLGGGNGGGRQPVGVGSIPISIAPESRVLAFTITSSPIGAAIFVDGNNTGYTTPHTLRYFESELTTPKRVSLVNGTNTSVETYIISSQVVTTTTGGGGSYGGGYSGGGGGSGAGGGTSNNGMYENGLPLYQQQNIK